LITTVDKIVLIIYIQQILTYSDVSQGQLTLKSWCLS
jgi:hypothetical protein